MGVFPFSEDQKLLLVMSGIVILAIIAFWPVIDMVVWAGAIAVVLIPLHHRLSRTVPPSTSATFITIWIILGILLVMSAAASIMYNNLDYIGGMVTTIVKGFDNSAITFLLPKFTQEQLANMPNTLVQMLLHTLMSLTENLMLALLRISILFLSLAMLISYGEQIWMTLTKNLSPKLGAAVSKMSEITSNTIYSLIVVQISSAGIAFLIAIPFFYFFGYGNVLLFATLIGIAQSDPPRRICCHHPCFYPLPDRTRGLPGGGSHAPCRLSAHERVARLLLSSGYDGKTRCHPPDPHDDCDPYWYPVHGIRWFHPRAGADGSPGYGL